jgi:hypothetical protein
MVVLTATPGEILLQPGTYDAIITEVAVKERDGRTFLVWCFEVKYFGSKTTKVRRPTSMNFGPKSMARAIAEAALGRKVRPGELVDTNDLLGLRVRVVISRGTRPDGEETNRIEAVLPAPVENEDDLLF